MHEILTSQGNVAAQVERVILGFVPLRAEGMKGNVVLALGSRQPRRPARASDVSTQAALLIAKSEQKSDRSVISERIGYAAVSHPGGRHGYRKETE